MIPVFSQKKQTILKQVDKYYICFPGTNESNIKLTRVAASRWLEGGWKQQRRWQDKRRIPFACGFLTYLWPGIPVIKRGKSERGGSQKGALTAGGEPGSCWWTWRQKLQGSQESVQEQARFLTGHSTLRGYTRNKRRVLVNAVCSFYLRWTVSSIICICQRS